MQLKKVEIKNFRSIDSLTIETKNYDCHVLVGMNESGKSNILKALSLLRPDRKPIKTDKRIERSTDPLINESYVRFIFSLSNDDQDEIYEEIKSLFHDESLSVKIFQRGKTQYTMREFLSLKNEGLWIANIQTEKKWASSWALGADWKLLPHWQQAGKSGASFTDENGASHSVTPNQFFYANPSQLTLTSGGLIEGLTVDKVQLATYAKKVQEFIESSLPECIYWEYRESNLLPSSVNIATFAADPNTCVPLRSMFELAGFSREDIGPVLTEARTQPAHIYTNLLARVSAAATTHIRKVWTEYSDISIELIKNGDLVEPIVREKQLSLDFANRSDGFKRFVSFLLLISAQVHAETIQDTLILVDEPEIALHPSGAKNLRDELIHIGKNNYVFYSTHSIFMIDRDNIGRHFVVKKDAEITTCHPADKSVVQDEEVLYKALGFSIFEIISETNVIFEGWRDKQLFKAYLGKKTADTKKIKAAKVGLTHAEGVKDVRHVASLLELGNRKCLIISDADGPAKQYKKNFVEGKGCGSWAMYSDIQNIPAGYITAEDFLSIDYVISTARELERVYPALTPLTAQDFSIQQPKMPVLERWINSAIQGDERKVVISHLKDALFGDKLKANSIVDDYALVVGHIASTIP